MRIIRRGLSPIVVLAAYVGGYYGLRYLTDGSLDVLSADPPTFDGLIMLLVGALAWACYVWLAFGTLLMALSVIPGAVGRACGTLADKVTPAAYRKVAKIALGISLAAGPVLGTMPAHAAPVDNPAQAAAAAQVPSLDRPGTTNTGLPSVAQLPSLDRPSLGNLNQGLPTPDRPLSNTRASDAIPNPDRPQSNDPLSRASRGTNTEARAQHVVQRGDTLWDIAKDRLPGDASNADIAREWHRWYEHNREVIGGDPDLILPGQILQAPPTDLPR